MTFGFSAIKIPVDDEHGQINKNLITMIFAICLLEHLIFIVFFLVLLRKAPGLINDYETTSTNNTIVRPTLA